MTVLTHKHAWIAAPILWLAGVLTLVAVWALHTPEWIQTHFDNDGLSPVETTTIGFFWLQLALFWLLPPMRPGPRRALWLADFSLLTFFAICRQLDWHRLLVGVSDQPGATRGTPFKMKFLTNAANPLADRLIVAACFAVVLGLCAGTLLYFLRRLLKGFFSLHPVCWSMAFFGGTIILNQIVDRLPAEIRHLTGTRISDNMHALTTALEEGLELLLPLFVMLAILQAHFIYNNQPSDSASLARHRNL